MVKINRVKAYIKAIVVLNVVGSSPTGHPSKIPVSQELTGVLILESLIISLDFSIFAKLFVWIVSFLYFCSNPLRKKNWRFGSTAESNRIKDIR